MFRHTSTAAWNRCHLIYHTHTHKWQLEKDSLEWVKSKEGTFLDDFPVQPIKSSPCTPCDLVFQFFMISFSLTIPLIPLGVKGQVFACNWGNALTSMPSIAILLLKLLIARLSKVWPADFFCSRQVPPTLEEKIQDHLKKRFTYYTPTRNWSGITHHARPNTTIYWRKGSCFQFFHMPIPLMPECLYLTYHLSQCQVNIRTV